MRHALGASRNQSEDQSDVEKVLSGDIAAFEGIVRRWQGPLINLAYRFCRDRARAEDMAQEAFLRAYRGLAKWRRDAAFSTWLFALATNLYCSELRRIPTGMMSLDEIAEPRDFRAMDGGLEEEDRDQAVRRAVDALPQKYREALILFYFQEMDVPAAAQSLGLPAGTVKARLFRGRQLLRSKLPTLLGARSLQEEICPKECT
ncbi:MAG TPA: sigma-70 family RNA polymerase sigma factor [Acidobacteriaceae bacterium]|jgi:RNA polymerase sigma-70 factor (ECF subfamily)|nr:sigma-70 family RNA polymerase sigma factor [Acidobacteriaceae bacterium]